MKSILTAFALPFFAACQTAQPPSPGDLSDWQPYIDQPIRQLEEMLAQTEQQQPRNFTISNIAFLYDAKLKILFHDYLTGLPESEHGREVAQQRQWLEERAEAVRIASEEYEGGTLASFVAGQTSIEATRSRIEEIEARMRGRSL